MRLQKDGTALLKAPLSSFRSYGDYFFSLLGTNDTDFCDWLYNLGCTLQELTARLARQSYNDVIRGTVTAATEFYPEYSENFGAALGIGYSLDFAVDIFLKENTLEPATVSYTSFLDEETIQLQQIFKSDLSAAERHTALLDHSLKFAWLSTEYAGIEHVTIEKLYSRAHESVPLVPSPDSALARPTTLADWVAFLTHLRDQRRKLNSIGMYMLDRYLKHTCALEGHDYTVARMLSVEEFEHQKNGTLQHYTEKIAEITPIGMKPLTTNEWQRILETEYTESTELRLRGITGSPGCVQGTVRIVRTAADMHAFQPDEVLIAFVTTPEMNACIKQAAAVVTNEGGLTSHAASTSREYEIPCLLATEIGAKVFMTGDLVEVNASGGYIQLLKRT